MIGMSMTRLISKIFFLFLTLILTSCEKQIVPEAADADNVVLTFTPTFRDVTRGTSVTAFKKLNVMLFDAQGNRVFDKVRTQLSSDEDFCTLSLKLTAGTYWVVAVGHSSTISATIKSPEVVQFTASEGEKLTDTFCHCSQITIGGETNTFTLPMYRAGAMIQFCLTDESVPDNFAYFLMEYTGGSANSNPQTLEGITKSSQSEKRIRNDLMIHQAYTFPYLATSCLLKITVSATDMDGTVIRKRVCHLRQLCMF